MDIVRYKDTRKRLIDLYQDLSFSGFRMLVPPHMLMSVEELKNRETVTFGDSYTWGGVNQHQEYLITVPMLGNLIKGINPRSNIGFYDAEDSMILFKKITEYLELWMDIANECPQYYIPHIEELYQLEDIALWIFHTYKPTMITRINLKRAKEEKKTYDPNMNVFELMLRMGASGTVDDIPENIEFNSVIDSRLPDRLRSFYNQLQAARPQRDVEEEWRLDMADIANLLG